MVYQMLVAVAVDIRPQCRGNKPAFSTVLETFPWASKARHCLIQQVLWSYSGDMPEEFRLHIMCIEYGPISLLSMFMWIYIYQE